jgi:excinuclease UvrABC nuclease subunit
MNEQNDGKWKPIGDTPMNTEKRRSTDIIIKSGIYGLRNKITGKWYIGKSIDVEYRWSNYKRLNCKKTNQTLPRSYKVWI